MRAGKRRNDPRRARSPARLASLQPAALGLCLALLIPAALRADQPPPAPPPADDLDVIEFLGSVGSDDSEWLKYLAQTDPTAATGTHTSGPAGNGSQKND